MYITYLKSIRTEIVYLFVFKIMFVLLPDKIKQVLKKSFFSHKGNASFFFYPMLAVIVYYVDLQLSSNDNKNS